MISVRAHIINPYLSDQVLPHTSNRFTIDIKSWGNKNLKM